MRKFTIALIALITGILATSMAGAQGKMENMDKVTKMQDKKMMSGKMDMMHKTMMMGLTADEKKTAMAHMKHMTKAENAVMMKKCMMCMKDKHTGMADMKMDEKAGMAHMMKGLSMSEQATMKKMWSRMSKKQMAVAKKMMMNCCKYGMKHGK